MIVVDASIAVKWVIPEPDSAKARTLQIERLAAPAIWLVEAANALWRHVRVSQLTEMEAVTRLRQLRNAAIDSVPVDADIDQALALALETGHPIYDCLYLALAIRENTYAVTADTRFSSAVRRHGKWNANLRLLSEL